MDHNASPSNTPTLPLLRRLAMARIAVRRFATLAKLRARSPARAYQGGNFGNFGISFAPTFPLPNRPFLRRSVVHCR